MLRELDLDCNHGSDNNVILSSITSLYTHLILFLFVYLVLVHLQITESFFLLSFSEPNRGIFVEFKDIIKFYI